MKKLLLIFCFPIFLIGSEIKYQNFDENTFTELVEKIEILESKKPVKDKWMKQSEYEKLYNQYLNENNAEIFYKINLGDIEVPCSSFNKTFCYDVDREKIIITPDYGSSDNDKLKFLIKTDTDNYSGQTTIQKNLGTSTEILKVTNYYDVVVLENLNSYYISDLPSLELPIPLHEIKNNEKEYSAYLIFSITPISIKNRLSDSGKRIESKEPTIDSPYQFIAYERQIYGNHKGILLKKSNKVIFNSITKPELSIMPTDDYIPLFVVAPVYPRRAQEKGVEGVVVVSFDVTKNGKVKNINIVEAFCGDIDSSSYNFLDYKTYAKKCSTFNKSAKKAASKLKYKPTLIEGKPVLVKNVTHRFSYVMADN